MHYQVVVPSYDRSVVCHHKTLATLQRFSVDADLVTVFVASEDEKERYDAEFSGNWRTVVAELGVFRARRFINGYFKEGTQLLSLDDDIDDILQKDGTRCVPYTGTIEDLAVDGFSQCASAGARLWGVYPAANGLFMNDYTVLGLRLVCGALYGSFAGDDVFLGERSLHSSGEDIETTLRSFVAYQKIVRLEYLTYRTKYFARGGIDAELNKQGVNRASDNTARLHEIAARFPSLTSTYLKAGGVTNIKFKNITQAKIPR
jgi:hypothetical protein